MRFVPIKRDHEQDMLAQHRVREQLIKNRTALANQIRGLLRERGITVRRRRAEIHQGPAVTAASVRTRPNIRTQPIRIIQQLGRLCTGGWVHIGLMSHLGLLDNQDEQRGRKDTPKSLSFAWAPCGNRSICVRGYAPIQMLASEPRARPAWTRFLFIFLSRLAGVSEETRQSLPARRPPSR
jgi:hypothetical protein